MQHLPARLLASLLLLMPAAALAADPLQPLNMRPEAAQQAVFDTFSRGFVTLPSGYVAFWALDDAHRAALVPSLLTFVRGYVESAAFATQLDAAHPLASSDPARPAHPGEGRRAEQLVADRLRQFLELSADVDFAARMRLKDGRTFFVDPKLEGRPAEWKLCYRAGPKTLGAARAFAADWLNDLAGSR